METPLKDSSALRPLRLWPGVVAVALLWLARFGLKALTPGFEGFQRGILGGLACAAAVLVWWLLFSRARWAERLGGLGLMALGLWGAWSLRHESMGPLWLVGYAVPVLLLAFVAWAVVTRHVSGRRRWVTLAATILLACGSWLLVRTEGVSGDHVASFGWRWAASAEERLLAGAGSEPARPPALEEEVPLAEEEPEPMDPGEPPEEAPPESGAPAARTEAPASSALVAERTPEWPGFRGPRRDGVVTGVRIETDWSTTPPVELWRRPVGPGWSSFAVDGGRLYTQEQRGEAEIVACYDTASGAPLWQHRDATRFFESNAGAGPRGTPTLHDGRVYALGATGILNALEAEGGTVEWSRDAAGDTGVDVPTWGFSSSPLVVGELVVVAVSGRLAAYDRDTGGPRWTGPARGESYSSPHLLTIGGVEQVVLMTADGAISVDPADGATLWEHQWGGFPMLQPAVLSGGDLLIVASVDSGTRRLKVTRGADGWTVEEKWTSRRLKPYFNDFVVHDGHAYGFDGRILACVGLEEGERRWKGGRYGSGQLVLLADQGLLLVVSEEGEIALVAARPDGFSELARVPAIEGKTWNHPVVVDDLLLARNGAEMVAFRLPLPGS